MMACYLRRAAVREFLFIFGNKNAPLRLSENKCVIGKIVFCKQKRMKNGWAYCFRIIDFRL